MECLDCGYDLRGLPTGPCPECGREFDLHVRSTYGPPEAEELSRLMLIVAKCSAIGPLVSVALFHVARVVAWIELGHWPLPMRDDPKYIGPATDVACTIAGLGCYLMPLSMLAVLGLVSTLASGRVRGGRRMLLIIFGGWIGAILLFWCASENTIEWFMD